MRDRLEAYRAWAPEDALWSPWAKPAPFAAEPLSVQTQQPDQQADWLPDTTGRTAVIVDLPGALSVAEGLALARRGFRPVPLYNGVRGPSAKEIVKTHDLVGALFGCADELSRLLLRADAPPAFLLDSKRMYGPGKQPGTYDNRWSVFPQDMPSAAFLAQNGIDTVLVRAQEVQIDLSHILRRYQDAGLRIQLHDGRHLRPHTVSKPVGFRRTAYRFGILWGLRRNAAGGFGSMVPDTSDGTGGRYYGFG